MITFAFPALPTSYMNNTSILIVEDEEDIQDVIALSLETKGFTTFRANDGLEGFTAAIDLQPSLILVDWMMPNVNGLELLRRLKRDQRTADIPVIMLSAKSEAGHKSQGLDEGADDYLSKPFSPKELVSRIKAVLRRIYPNASKQKIFKTKDLSLDLENHLVTIGERPLNMGPTEFKLLHFFLSHPNRVYSREQLLNNVWGSNVYLDERTVDVHIRRLRKALSIDQHEKLIQTVRGVGYRFSDKI